MVRFLPDKELRDAISGFLRDHDIKGTGGRAIDAATVFSSLAGKKSYLIEEEALRLISESLRRCGWDGDGLAVKMLPLLIARSDNRKGRIYHVKSLGPLQPLLPWTDTTRRFDDSSVIAALVRRLGGEVTLTAEELREPANVDIERQELQVVIKVASPV
ncbi:MAG TPA: hypothetical protein VG944_03685 [Fimbriimonas sp.]|nr:hypothetical protein [Fimbriimonas sp.]